MDPLDLSRLDDAQLADLAAAISAERRRRAVANSDLEALTEVGFDQGFDSKGVATDPWFLSGVLICPGSLIGKAGGSHECRFVHVDDCWVWEHPDTIWDTVRKGAIGTRDYQRSVSLVVPSDGASVDVVTMACRMGVHTVKRTRSYRVVGDALEQVDSRVFTPARDPR